MKNPILRAILGEDGKLRFFWRAIIYFAAGGFLISPLLDKPFEHVAAALHLGRQLTAANIFISDVQNFSAVFLATVPYALYEWRRIDSYGLWIGRAFSRATMEGFIAGLILAAAVAGGMFALGGMQIAGLAGSGSAVAISGLAWLGTMLFLGLTEEFWFRSYFLYAFWRSLGFWPGAIAVALVFTALHYFFKKGENVWDVITLMSLSLLLSYSLRRSGTLWFAVGFHAAFDFMQFFVIGTPNGSMIPVGRLLDVRFAGPAWLTGGVLGTEASFLMYPAIAALWLYVWLRWRGNPDLDPNAARAPAISG